ncbi:response regulator [Sphingosinicellaceae bacterium A1X5R2]|nr:response regulator [Pedomonas mirosovicensis]MCH8686570.1 response regulator [Pedomonas mirosovicensis]
MRTGASVTTLAIDRRLDPLLYGILAILIAVPFGADLLLPLGTAVWVIYLFPVVLSYLTTRPLTPVMTAALATVLMVAGYFFAPSGVDPDIAQINRILGGLTAWIIAGIGYLFIRNRLAIRREEWLQAGQVNLALRLGGEQRLDQLGENILGFLSEHMGAQAGAIFTRNGDGFHRIATYGTPADAPVPERFHLSDGLLGQAVKDKRGFTLAPVPDNYLYFGSALGRGKPRSLVIAVARADGMVNAVMELGLPGAVDPVCTELLNRVSEVIGVAIRSAEYRARLQELLEETQQQAEELQQQSEELRAANEELEAQTRALQDSQSRLEVQQSELEETNAQLEEQAQALEAQRDELSRAQATLEEQASELERASQYKSEFLANMSHELRTPLNSLLIMARLLADNRDGNLTPDQVKYAETIEISGNDLLVLINDVLDISKIEAGHLELNLRRVRIAPILSKLQTAFEASATEKGLNLRTELLPELPKEIETDPQRVEQVLRNFLSNAVKFTEKGEVTLMAGRTADGRLAFTVRDTGIGIPAEQQEVIFDAFRQADGTISRKYGGTGLGLSISRELARLLGGEITVESRPGEGSAFSLILPENYAAAAQAAPMPQMAQTPTARSLPLTPPKAQAARPAQPPAPRSVTKGDEERPRAFEDDRERLTGDSRIILVVEDDPAFARILYDLAHEVGFACLVAETADEGVVMARQYLPQAVILDIGLPDHTGLSVLDRIKRDVRTRHIPVHIVSVSDYAHLALSYGAAGYMLKPVKREELVRVLEGLEAQLAQRMRRVLIVEDDANQLESLRLLLATRDVETVNARTAAECLGKLSAGIFDCMVLDLNLPDMSGLDLLEKLSLDEAVSFPPVIVYTGKELSADEELRLRKYSKSIIIKGARSPERLLDEVTLFLHQVVSELPELQRNMLTKSLSRDSALEGRHILVVEDDIRNVYALTSIFEPHGASVRIARNGIEALRALEETSQPDARPVDLVLMDVMMPEMDGLTAMREIRRRPEWKTLPIIALTAKAMAHDQEQCLAAGANDYLAKPLDVDKLLSLVRVWMPR